MPHSTSWLNNILNLGKKTEGKKDIPFKNPIQRQPESWMNGAHIDIKQGCYSYPLFLSFCKQAQQLLLLVGPTTGCPISI